MGKVLDFVKRNEYNIPKYPQIDMNDFDDAKEKELKYAEEMLQDISIPMIEYMGECGFNMKDPQFHSDMSIVVKFLRPLVYRQLGIHHELHKPLEEIAQKDFVFTVYPRDMFSKENE